MLAVEHAGHGHELADQEHALSAETGYDNLFFKHISTIKRVR